LIRGIEFFKEYFRDYKEQYVLIGGTACNLIFEEVGADFRATKDLDLVLIVEALTPEFGSRLWDFIVDGGYTNKVRSNGKPQLYRFDKPERKDFPHMIELFTRTDVALADIDSRCLPVHLGDDISSLSAIIMDDDYYGLLLKGKRVIEDLVVLSNTYLIPYKAKAWLDLSQRKDSGFNVSEGDIRKHKNDIVRLASILKESERCELPKAIKEDMYRFIKLLEEDPVQPKDLGISGLTVMDIIDVLKKVYM